MLTRRALLGASLGAVLARWDWLRWLLPVKTGAGLRGTTVLNWTDNAVEETAYHVEYRVRASNGLEWTSWGEKVKVPKGATSATIRGLPPGTPVDFRIRGETRGPLELPTDS